MFSLLVLFLISPQSRVGDFWSDQWLCKACVRLLFLPHLHYSIPRKRLCGHTHHCYVQLECS